MAKVIKRTTGKGGNYRSTKSGAGMTKLLTVVTY